MTASTGGGNADPRRAWREWLVQAHHAASQDYDKAVMTLAGGALALSLTFIHDIVPNPRHEWSIAIAWSLLALSLLLIFVSLLTSQTSLLRNIKSLDEDVVATGGIAGVATVWLNALSGASFILGVGFLVGFAIGNI